VDRAVVEDDHNGLDHQPGLGAANPVEHFQEGDEIGDAIGAGGGDDEFAPVKAPIVATFCNDQVQCTWRSFPRGF
jgi:hypothetical protein